MKKIALFLVMIMVLLNIQTPIFAQTEEYSVEAETLYQLNIADRAMFSKPGAQVKRADFAMLAAALVGYKGEGANADPFIDINKEHYAAGSIEYLKDLGILNGYDDGSFRGEQPITYLESVILLTKILGYDSHAKLLGDNLSGYIKMAKNIDLDEGLSVNENAVLTQGEAFKLIYNALEIPVGYNAFEFPVGKVHFTEGVLTYGYDDSVENAMNVWLGIDKVSGVVKNIGNASITTDATGSGGMTVGNRQLSFADDANYYYALGRYCDVYFYNDGSDKADEVVAVVELPYANDITEISTDDVIDFSNGVLRYQKDGKNIRNIRIDANYDVCVNGEPVSANQRENALLNSDGKIIINKINASDISTVVMIESYQTCFVASINKDDKVIYGKFGKKIELDENDTVFIYDEYSAPATFEDISVNDVLTVKSGADLIEIHISKQSETGVINRVKKDDDIAYVVIGDKEYKLTSDQLNNINSVKLNDNVVAYLDIFGRIAYMTTSSGGFSYAYLCDIALEEFEGKIRMKLYTIGGGFIECGADERLRVDEDRISKLNNVYAKLERGTGGNGFRQIVRYSLSSDGKINKIDTVYKGVGETDNSLHIMHKGYSDEKEETVKLIWKPRAGSFEGKVLYNSSSVKFLTVPKNYTNDENFFFIGKTMAEDDQVAFNAYVSSKEQLMPDVLLSYIDNSTGTTAGRVSETFRGVITEIEEQLNSEGDTETRILFDTYGGEKNFAAHDDFDKDRIMAYSTTEDVQDAIAKFDSGEIGTTYKIEKGDFVEITVDSLNRVIFARAMIKANTGECVMDKNEGGSVYNHRVVYGFMHKNDGNVIRVALGDKASSIATEDLRYYNVGSARVYRVSNGRKTTVEKISIEDIADYSSSNIGAEKVVVYANGFITQIIVAYGE